MVSVFLFFTIEKVDENETYVGISTVEIGSLENASYPMLNTDLEYRKLARYKMFFKKISTV